MAESTKIQWCDATWNPFQGCKKVSEGCRNCYMYRQKESYNQDPMTVVRSKDPTFNLPLKLKEPSRIFVCSWSDFFIEDADEWRADAWDIIRKTPHHTYIILTKRPERILQCLPDDWGCRGWPHAWLLVSIEDHATAEKRIPLLLDVNAAVHGVSLEPMLEDVDLMGIHDEDNNRWDVLRGLIHLEGRNEPAPTNRLDWVILGGESGDIGTKFDPRPVPVNYMERIVRECKAAHVPAFVKQMGTLWAKANGDTDSHGGTLEKFPPALQVREFPK